MTDCLQGQGEAAGLVAGRVGDVGDPHLPVASTYTHRLPPAWGQRCKYRLWGGPLLGSVDRPTPLGGAKMHKRILRTQGGANTCFSTLCVCVCVCGTEAGQRASGLSKNLESQGFQEGMMHAAPWGRPTYPPAAAKLPSCPRSWGAASRLASPWVS